MEMPAMIDNYVELVKKGLRTLGARPKLKPVPEPIYEAVKAAYEEKYGEEPTK